MSPFTAAAAEAQGVHTLRRAGNEDAQFDARQLLMHVTGWDHAGLLLHKSEALPPAAVQRYEALIGRRAAGEPLQYILGKWQFYQSEFFVGPGVLIPRPETEALTDAVVRRLAHKSKSQVVYDLCAGSGCIGISIALACPRTAVYLFEKSSAALSYLQQNVAAAACPRLHVVRHDIFDACPPGLPAPEVIVSNPPYIPANELAGLQKEVRREPAMALDGGADGLDFYRRLTSYWIGRLPAGGLLAFECGEGQAKAVASMASADFYTETGVDVFGTERFVFGERR